jgi:hypothetical protein
MTMTVPTPSKPWQPTSKNRIENVLVVVAAFVLASSVSLFHSSLRYSFLTFRSTIYSEALRQPRILYFRY